MLPITDHPNMTLRTRVLAHYDRMIEWAEKQTKRDTASYNKMRDALEEAWGSRDCPLCQLFLIEGRCGDCPTKHPSCKGTPWVRMHKAGTWRTWLKHARLEREFLAGLDYSEAKNGKEQ